MGEDEIIKKKLKQISLQVKNADIDSAMVDLQRLHDMLVATTGLLEECYIILPGVQFEFYEAMLIKFRLNIRSILELYAPGAAPKDNIIYHDLSSIYLLSRSLLENYLIFFYCFRLPADDDEALMNFYIFKLSGLVTHYSYGKYDPVPEPLNKEVMQGREQRIDHCKSELNKLACFLALSAKDQKAFLEGKHAKRFGFTKLIELSPLQNLLFADIWRLYSNYAHSEMVSLTQINCYSSDRTGHDRALFSTLTQVLMLTAVLIKDHLDLLEKTPAANIDLPEINDDNLALIKYWHTMATTAGSV